MTVGTEPQRYTLFESEAAIVRHLASRAACDTRGDHAPWTRHAVEIGAYTGTTTTRLYRELQIGQVQLVVIDPWDGTQDGAGEQVYDAWRQATWYHNAHYEIVIRQRSQDVTPPPRCCFVFHDGDHRDLSDLPRWWDALLPRGILVVHDVCDPGWPNVRAAVEAFGPPWHEYRYVPDAADVAEYGPGSRGLAWKVKP